MKVEDKIKDCFIKIGWLEEEHKGILNFKAFSNGAWTDVQKIRELYELIMKELKKSSGDEK